MKREKCPDCGATLWSAPLRLGGRDMRLDVRPETDLWAVGYQDGREVLRPQAETLYREHRCPAKEPRMARSGFRGEP